MARLLPCPTASGPQGEEPLPGSHQPCCIATFQQQLTQEGPHSLLRIIHTKLSDRQLGSELACFRGAPRQGSECPHLLCMAVFLPVRRREPSLFRHVPPLPMGCPCALVGRLRITLGALPHRGPQRLLMNQSIKGSENPVKVSPALCGITWPLAAHAGWGRPLGQGRLWIRKLFSTSDAEQSDRVCAGYRLCQSGRLGEPAAMILEADPHCSGLPSVHLWDLRGRAGPPILPGPGVSQLQRCPSQVPPPPQHLHAVGKDAATWSPSLGRHHMHPLTEGMLGDSSLSRKD